MFALVLKMCLAREIPGQNKSKMLLLKVQTNSRNGCY